MREEGARSGTRQSAVFVTEPSTVILSAEHCELHSKLFILKITNGGHRDWKEHREICGLSISGDSVDTYQSETLPFTFKTPSA